MKNKTIKIMILVMLLSAVMLLATNQPTMTNPTAGEILWKRDRITLYHCGPNFEDICLDDGYRVTKVYVGEN